mgnify:CR=1 FL=1
MAASMSDRLQEAARLLLVPPPGVSEAEAEAFARQHYGPAAWDGQSASGGQGARDGQGAGAQALNGERDRNFRLGGAVLKFYNPAEEASTRALQHGALRHLAAEGLPTPRLIPTLTGAEEAVAEIGGQAVAAVMLTCLPGRMPATVTPALRRDVGAVAGRLMAALAGYTHPAAERVILWDMMRLPLLRPLAETEPRLLPWFERFEAEMVPAAASLPHQAIHNDLSLSNLLVGSTGAVTGVVDFGDLVLAPRVNELAIAASYFITPRDDPVAAVAEMLAEAAPFVRLTQAELLLLPDLIRARLATRILLSTWRAGLFPENAAYILRSNTAAWALWARLEGEGDMAPHLAALAGETA